VDTRHDQTARVITRRRECKTDPTHVFHTQEAARAATIGQTFVRRASDGVVTGKFSLALLVRDLRTAVLGRLPEAELAAIANDVSVHLAELLSEISLPLSPAEQAKHSPGRYGVSILDTEVMEVAEDRLRHASDRSAHILYALGVRGRVDVPQRGGLKDATALLTWIYSDGAYPDLRQAIPESRPRAIERWWPSVHVAVPSTVVKKSGAHRVFGKEQFVNSIHMAMIGRHRADETSKLVGERALEAFAGQRVVLSTQLSSEVTRALRQYDDIAYLRWVTVAKGYTSVRQVAFEAVDLVSHPSTRLIFDPTVKREP